MRKVFIADAHLRSPEDLNYGVLLGFLERLTGTTDTLFILGDFFEFWIGYKDMPFTHYLPVLDRLKKIADSGTAIVYFEGNHDFHMGPFFAETLKATVYRGPGIISINGKSVYLCHGDEIMRHDLGYGILRFLLHNRLSGLLFPLIPYRITSGIANLMSRQSKGHHGKRNVKWDYITILRDFASRKFSLGCDAVISAHFHLPHLEKSGAGNGEKTLISLGDWKSQFSYAEWRGDSLTLEKFHP